MKLPTLLILILVSFLSCEPIKKDNSQNNQSISFVEGSTTSEILKEQEVIFYYNKMEMIALRGKEVIQKEERQSSGKVVFSQSGVKFYQGNAFERYIISSINSHPDGIELRTANNKNDKCVISIIRRNNVDLVSAHFIDMEMMLLVYITNGFTLDIDFYK